MGREPPPDDRLVAFYTREYRESARLQRPSNRLELARTQQLLRDRLPAPPAKILDVGGGTGVHAGWLGADGYDVTLVDVVPDHVRAANELSATLPRPFAARVGDARSLDVDGLADVEVLGIEGFAWPLLMPDLPEDRVERLLEASIRAARLYDGHREMTAASAHLLAVGRRA